MRVAKHDRPKLRRFAHDVGSDMIDRGVPIGLRQNYLVEAERFPRGQFDTEIFGHKFRIGFHVEDMIGSTVVTCQGKFRFRLEPGIEVCNSDPPSI